MSIKIIAFDVFGTIVDFSSVPRHEKVSYIEQIKCPEWQPLNLPDHWAMLYAHHDVHDGMAILRRRIGARLVTLSNGPLPLLTKLSWFNGIQWDMVVPLELAKVYKPNPAAYRFLCDLLNVPPQDILMVTANKDFGDLENARSIGMQSVLIRDPAAKYEDLIDLANNYHF